MEAKEKPIRDDRFFTFPVCLLENGIEDIKKVASLILTYCVYNEARKNTGTIDEKMKKAIKYFKLPYYVNFSYPPLYNEGELLFNSIPPKAPKTSLNVNIVSEFHKENKDEFEIVCFLAFAALRSILQKKPFVRITNDFFLARMAGHNKALKEEGEPLPEALKKYCNRYQIDKIKTELRNNWRLKYYGFKTYGFYISFQLELTDLIFQVEKKRKKNVNRLYKEEEKEAKRKAIYRLYSTAP
jgi:hypothetical protein